MVRPSKDRLLDDTTYREARTTADQIRSDQSKFIDKTNLTLGGGALGLSLTFLRGYSAPLAKAWMLYSGGASLILGIVLVLFSLHVSQWAIETYINRLDSVAEEQYSKPLSYNKYVNFSARLTQYLNWAASAFIVCGIVLLAIFGYANESALIQDF